MLNWVNVRSFLIAIGYGHRVMSSLRCLLLRNPDRDIDWPGKSTSTKLAFGRYAEKAVKKSHF